MFAWVSSFMRIDIAQNNIIRVTAIIEMFQAGNWGFLGSVICSWLWLTLNLMKSRSKITCFFGFFILFYNSNPV